jgi:uncharacterized membrane-anchored protein
MDRKKIIILAFALMVLAQFYVPFSMIWESENILLEGTPYKFRTEPIDPNDPFRGKYIVLGFRDNSCTVNDKTEWMPDETVYVTLENKDGYAHLKSLQKEEPQVQDFLKVRVSYQSFDSGTNRVYLNFPFNKYYMEESKAFNAEQIYREKQLDTNLSTYALVYVKDGVGRLSDVKIGDSSIRDIAR